MDTFFSTLLAGVRTNAAVFHSHICMLAAFLRTARTDIGTDLTDAVDVFPFHHHYLSRRSANGRTFEIQPDAIPQISHLLLLDAGTGTLLTHRRAINARIDAGL